jgi:hypothetical protein
MALTFLYVWLNKGWGSTCDSADSRGIPWEGTGFRWRRQRSEDKAEGDDEQTHKTMEQLMEYGHTACIAVKNDKEIQDPKGPTMDRE